MNKEATTTVLTSSPHKKQL